MKTPKGWKRNGDFYYETTNGMVEIGINQEVDILDKVNGRYKYGVNHGLWYVYTTRKPRKWFKTKAQARKYAFQYMKSHPKG